MSTTFWGIYYETVHYLVTMCFCLSESPIAILLPRSLCVNQHTLLLK